MKLNSDFKELLRLLNRAHVKYLVVGGYAVIEHTEPLYTKEIDIWVKTDPENAERVYACLKKFGAPLTNIGVEDFTDPGVVYHMGRPPARVDILMGLSGLDFDACWDNRLEANYGSEVIPFLSNRDLVINRRIVGRPQPDGCGKSSIGRKAKAKIDLAQLLNNSSNHGTQTGAQILPP